MIEVMAEVFHLDVLALMVLGIFAGMFAGALPGITATLSVALLVPFTFWIEPLSGMMVLLGIYVGAMFGGAVPAILLKTPGTPAAAATCFDGYPLTQKSQAGLAIGVACLSSFVGGLFGALVLIAVAPQMAQMALKFGPAEYFALAIFGLTIIASVSEGSLIKGLLMGTLGLLISTVGLDPMTAFPRFTFGSENLLTGVAFIPIMIGVFAIAESLHQIERWGIQKNEVQPVGGILPSLDKVKRIMPATLLGSAIGTVIGAIPGTGGDIASFVSYSQAKRLSRHPEEFGRGSIEGLSAAEAANNSITGGALIPMLTLGIPGDAVTAVLLGALMIHGLRPGPLLFEQQPTFVQGIFVGLIVINLISLPISLLTARLFAKIMNVPKYYLWPVVLVLCVVGSFSLENNLFSVWVMFVFGIVGYLMQKLRFPPGPLVLGVILGPMAESNLRRALILSKGSPWIFLQKPLALALLLFALLSLGHSLRTELKGRVDGKS